MVEKVFIALDGSGLDKYIDWRYILISASTYWRKKSFRRNIYLNPNVREIFLDSGGFSFFSRHGDYLYKPLQYIRFAKRINANYVAIMDYPCEPTVNRSIYKTNKERIDKTIANAIKLMDLAPEINWVMVIQGYTIDEYLYAIDMAKEHGLLTPLTAIGSLCVRRRVKDTRQLLLTLRKEIPSKIKLHGFGIDFRFLKNPVVFETLYSADTSAWSIPNDKRQPKTQKEKLELYLKYKRKLEAVLKYHNSQTKLNLGGKNGKTI